MLDLAVAPLAAYAALVDREGIIAELRRCARENGGAPPGRERFQALTGIRESDWSGRYWVKWSDLVREAGYEPSAMNSPHAESHLLAHLAAFVGELGRWPTRAELKLHRRGHPAFPSPNTFDRLGRRSELARRLLEYALAHDLADVAEACRPLVGDGPPSEGAEGEVSAVAGMVYLMRSGQYYKVGRSNSVGRRHYELAIQLPEALELVHSFETDDPVGIERYWHERFAEKRANGEWFRLSRSDVAAFRRRRRFM